MGFLDKLFRKDRDINEWVQEAAGVAGSVLLDVRTREEYRQGHIPGSVNVPLSELAAVDETISAKDTPLYVYCLSGGRSARAAAQLSGMGYASVVNMGGIAGWKGNVVEGGNVSLKQHTKWPPRKGIGKNHPRKMAKRGEKRS